MAEDLDLTSDEQFDDSSNAPVWSDVVIREVQKIFQRGIDKVWNEFSEIPVDLSVRTGSPEYNKIFNRISKQINQQIDSAASRKDDMAVIALNRRLNMLPWRLATEEREAFLASINHARGCAVDIANKFLEQKSNQKLISLPFVKAVARASSALAAKGMGLDEEIDEQFLHDSVWNFQGEDRDTLMRWAEMELQMTKDYPVRFLRRLEGMILATEKDALARCVLRPPVFTAEDPPLPISRVLPLSNAEAKAYEAKYRADVASQRNKDEPATMASRSRRGSINPVVLNPDFLSSISRRNA